MTEMFSAAAGYNRRTEGLRSIDLGQIGMGSLLRKSFSAVAGTAFDAERKPDQSQTLMQSLTGQSFQVRSTNLDQFKLSTNATTAQSAQVAPNTQVVQNVGMQVQTMKSAVSDTIREAQRQIADAAKDVGADMNALFPQDNLTPKSEAGLVFQAAANAASGMMGMGSLATAINGVVGTAEVMGDRKSLKGKSPEEAIAAIRERLIEKQAAAEQRGQAMQTNGSGAEPASQPKQKMDWKNALDQHGDGIIKQIATMDPKNPVGIPEWDRLQQQEAKVAEVQGTIDNTKENIGLEFHAGEAALAMSKGQTEVVQKMVEKAPEPEKVQLASDSLRGYVGGLRLVKLDTAELDAAVNESLPRPGSQPAPAFRMATSPNAGMAA